MIQCDHMQDEALLEEVLTEQVLTAVKALVKKNARLQGLLVIDLR